MYKWRLFLSFVFRTRVYIRALILSLFIYTTTPLRLGQIWATCSTSLDIAH
jgi:hypothetical protein